MKRSSFTTGAALVVGAAALAGGAAVAEPSTLGSWVERIEVEHLPDRIATRVRLTPQALATYPDVVRKTFGASAVVGRLVAAAKAVVSTAEPEANTYDCRWLVTFSGAGRHETIASDAFGRRGAIDGKPVRLDAAELLETIRNVDPALEA